MHSKPRPVRARRASLPPAACRAALAPARPARSTRAGSVWPRSTWALSSPGCYTARHHHYYVYGLVCLVNPATFGTVPLLSTVHTHIHTLHEPASTRPAPTSHGTLRHPHQKETLQCRCLLHYLPHTHLPPTCTHAPPATSTHTHQVNSLGLNSAPTLTPTHPHTHTPGQWSWPLPFKPLRVHSSHNEYCTHPYTPGQ